MPRKKLAKAVQVQAEVSFVKRFLMIIVYCFSGFYEEGIGPAPPPNWRRGYLLGILDERVVLRCMPHDSQGPRSGWAWLDIPGTSQVNNGGLKRSNDKHLA